MAATTTAIVLGTLAAAAMTKQTLDARKARKEAVAKSDRDAFKAQEAEKAERARIEEEDAKSKLLEDRTRARARQRAATSAAQGRSGTILGGADGGAQAASAPQQGGKTLLGS